MSSISTFKIEDLHYSTVHPAAQSVVYGTASPNRRGHYGTDCETFPLSLDALTGVSLAQAQSVTLQHHDSVGTPLQ